MPKAPAKKKPKPLRESQLQIRLTESEKQLFEEAAQSQHMSVSAWIRLAALQVAKTQQPLT